MLKQASAFTLRRPVSWHSSKSKPDINSSLARKIFNCWDLTNSGFVNLEDILSITGIKPVFIKSLFRAIDADHSGEISLEELDDFVRILQQGSIEKKTDLLLHLADTDASGNILLDPIQMQILNKLNTKKKIFESNALAKNEIKALFLNENEGIIAIEFFASHILKVLSDFVTTKQPSTIEESNKNSKTWNGLNILLHYFSRIPNAWRFNFTLVILQIILFVYVFIQIRNQGFIISIAVAKGFGINLRLLSIIQYLTMTRTIMALFSSVPMLRVFVPLGVNIQVHSFLGFSLLLHSMGHTLAHIIACQILFSNGVLYRFVQPSLILGSSWNVQKPGDAITGFILLLMIVSFSVAAVFRGYSSFKYKLFAATHYLHLVWPVMILLHTPYNLPYVLAMVLLFIVDRAYDFFFLTTFSTLVDSRPGAQGMSYVAIKRVSPAAIGCFYRIKVPAISMWEWHPFSLAGGTSSDYLTFFVASAGDWSKSLFELVSSPRRAEFSILVQGPFFAPSSYASGEKMILAVATGVGITPFFSTIATRVSEQQVAEFDRVVFHDMFEETMSIGHRSFSFSRLMIHSLRTIRRIICGNLRIITLTSAVAPTSRPIFRVLWIIRDVEELLFYFDYLRNLLLGQDRLPFPQVEMDIYMTGLGTTKDPALMLSQTFFLLALSNRNEKYFRIHFGRPDMERILKSFQPQECYYCGGGALRDSVNKLCNDNKVRFFSEVFDDGGFVMKWIMGLMKSRGKKRMKGHDGSRSRFASHSKVKGLNSDNRISSRKNTDDNVLVVRSALAVDNEVKQF